MVTEHYQDGTPCLCDRMERTYYESGELEYENPIVNGVIHGKQLSYQPYEVYNRAPKNDEDDLFEDIEDETKIVPDGDWVYKFETPFVYGIKQGLGYGYYYSEVIAVENQFDNDEFVYQKEFYTSGKILSEVAYHNDQKSGIERFYFESGELVEEVPYTDGKIHGTRVIHHGKEIFKDGWHIDKSSPHDYPDSLEGNIITIQQLNYDFV